MPGVRFSSIPGDLERLAYGEPDRSYCKQRAQMNAAKVKIGTLALLLATVALAGCGSSQDDGGSTPPDYDAALAGAPPLLAKLHRQANELLPGELEGYEKRVASLRGFPVVANVWASWCGPCRLEVPYFQQTGAEYGKRVAFLGIDRQDSDEFALKFLDEDPVPYPSYRDPDEAIAESIGAGLGMPDTAFYDKTGELVYLKQGPYTELGQLRADIERYALAGAPESG